MLMLMPFFIYKFKKTKIAFSEYLDLMQIKLYVLIYILLKVNP